MKISLKKNNIEVTFLKIYEDVLKITGDYKYEFFKEDTLEYKNVKAFINNIKKK